MSYKKETLLFLFFLLIFLAPIHDLQAQDLVNDKQYLNISHENDMFGGNSDRYYTSGTRISWFDSDIKVPPVIDALADEIPTFDLNESTSTYYTLGQNLYTPENISLREQPATDRPWAAFLYGSVGLASASYKTDHTLSHIDDLEFTLGVVGPEAFGKQTQKFIHTHVSNSPIPQGWNNQLKFEPGIILSWQRRFPSFWHRELGGLNARIEPNVSVSLGNIRTHAGTGATFVLGSDPLLDTPQRVRPAIPGTGAFLSKENTFNWQLFAGIDGRLVGRDIFLDGNTFSNSHSVDKEYLVGDFSTGVSLFYDDYRISYTLNMRSKEFKTQNQESIFGSITFTKRF